VRREAEGKLAAMAQIARLPNVILPGKFGAARGRRRSIPQDRHRPAMFASEERERELASDSQPSANSWPRGNARTVSIFTGCFAGGRCNAWTTGKRSPFPLRFTISLAVTPVSVAQLKRVQECSDVRWGVPLVEAVANIRTANKTAFMAIPLNAKRH
jgi:hypothetical protein